MFIYFYYQAKAKMFIVSKQTNKTYYNNSLEIKTQMRYLSMQSKFIMSISKSIM